MSKTKTEEETRTELNNRAWYLASLIAIRKLSKGNYVKPMEELVYDQVSLRATFDREFEENKKNE